MSKVARTPTKRSPTPIPFPPFSARGLTLLYRYAHPTGICHVGYRRLIQCIRPLDPTLGARYGLLSIKSCQPSFYGDTYHAPVSRVNQRSAQALNNASRRYGQYTLLFLLDTSPSSYRTSGIPLQFAWMDTWWRGKEAYGMIRLHKREACNTSSHRSVPFCYVVVFARFALD